MPVEAQWLRPIALAEQHRWTPAYIRARLIKTGLLKD